MTLWEKIVRWWSSEMPEPILMDHVPVGKGRNRTKKLKAAAKRYGKLFKCAGDTVPHEVMPSNQREQAAKQSNVSVIQRKVAK